VCAHVVALVSNQERAHARVAQIAAAERIAAAAAVDGVIVCGGGSRCAANGVYLRISVLSIRTLVRKRKKESKSELKERKEVNEE
jgi:hypothetical protein